MKYVLSEINVTMVTKIDRNEQYKAEIRVYEPMSARQAHQLVLTDVSRYTTNTGRPQQEADQRNCLHPHSSHLSNNLSIRLSANLQPMM